MNPSPQSRQAPTLDNVPAALRSDLVQTEQNYLGRKYLILKNPLGLSYYRLPVSHAKAAAKFDGKRNFRQILEVLRSEDRYWRSLPEERAKQEIIALATQLATSGLLRVSGGSAVARARQIKKIKETRWFEIYVGKILYFRKSLFDPDHLLESMLPYFGWIYTRTTIALATIFCLITFIASLRHWDEITTHATNFFTFENLALSWVLFFGVKIIHEFGHGLTCKRYGGEVHEMGFMFILFTPYLFCNVSDSWLASRAHRIYVTAAGILVELVIASIAAWLWMTTQQGLFNQMCFNTMFLCSISTVLFNANPLLKFDGYYVMTDLLEIPNLKQKSSTYITQWAQKTLLGVKSAQRSLASFELNPWFGVYAVLSYLYGWLVLYNISHMLFDKLKPYGLEVLSRTYVALFLFVSLGLPVYRLAFSVKNSPELKKQAAPRVRLVVLCLLGAIGLMFVIPWQDTIKRTVVVEHGKTDFIVPKDPGFLRVVAVRDGDSVKKGQLIGRLENEELATEKRILELEKLMSEVRYRAAISSPRVEEQQMAAAFRKDSKEMDEKLKGVNDKIRDLDLVAPRDGVIRSRQLKDSKGLYFSPEKMICEVGENAKLRAIIPLNEREARRVHAGQRAKFRLFADPSIRFEGTIDSQPVSPLPKFTSPVLANLFGGDVPAEADPTSGQAGQIRPSIPYYEAEVTFDEGSWELRPGMMGKARIYLGKTTLGLWLVDRAIDWLNPEMRL